MHFLPRSRFVTHLFILLLSVLLSSNVLSLQAQDTPAGDATSDPAVTDTATATPEPPTEVPTEVPTEATPEAGPTETVTEEPTVVVTDSPVTAEPSVTPTATVAPLPPEPQMGVLFVDSFESGLANWPSVAGWSLAAVNGSQALQTNANNPPVQPAPGALYNAAVQLRVISTAGSAQVSVRQSGSGAYTAVLAPSGLVELYRAGVAIGQFTAAPAVEGQARTLRISAVDGAVRVALDGIEVIGYLDTAPLPAGTISVLAVFPPVPEGQTPPPVSLSIDDVSVWVPLNELPAPTATPETPATPELIYVEGRGWLAPPAQEPSQDVSAAASSNDNFANSITVLPSQLPYTHNSNNTGNTLETGELGVSNDLPSCAFTGTTNWLKATAWYTFTPAFTDTYNINTTGSTFDTVLAIYTGSAVNALTQVACNDGFSSASVAGSTSTITLSLTAGTTYRIQVGGWDDTNTPWGQEGAYTLNIRSTTAAPGALTNISPLTGAVRYTGTPILNWTTLSSAYKYQVDISTNATFTGTPVFTTIVNGPPVTVSPALANGLYYWRVRGFNANNQYTASFANALTINVPGPAPALVSPLDVAVLTAARPTFSWGAVAGAARYELQLGSTPTHTANGGFASVIDTYPRVGDPALISPVLTLPNSLPQGTYFWSVRARDGEGTPGNPGPWSTPRSFTLNQLLLPADNAVVTSALVSTSIPFQWAPVLSNSPGGVPNYKLEISDDIGFGTLVPASPVSPVTTTLQAISLPYGVYYWRVAVQLTSGGPFVPAAGPYRKLTITPPAFGMPVYPPAPANPAFTNDTTPRLEWNSPAAITGATLIRYEWRLSTNYLFPVGASTQTGTVNHVGGTTSYFVDAPALPATPGALYYWQVRAFNQFDIPSAWSTLKSFTLDTTAPTTAPVLSTPLNNAVITAARPTLIWSLVATAAKYQIEVSTDSTFDVNTGLPTGAQTLEFSPVANSILLPTSLAQGTYYWTARGVDAAGNPGPFANPFSFTVDIKVAPLANTVTTLRQPTFVWALVPLNTGNPANTYTVEFDNNNDGNVDSSSPVLTTSAYMPATPMPYGNYKWRVNVNNGLGTGAWRPLTITPVMPVVVQNTPSAGFLTNDNTVTLSWNAVTAPADVLATLTDYYVEVSQSPIFAPGVGVSTYVTAYPNLSIDTNALADGVWYWRVYVKNQFGVSGPVSSVRSLVVDTTAPTTAPTLLQPLNNAITSAARPVLVWSIPLTAVKYNIEVSTDNTFSTSTGLNSPVVSINNHPANSIALTTSLPQGVYYWTVQPVDAAGNAGSFSAPFSFTVDIKVAPAVNTVTTLRQPTFVWALVTTNVGNPANTYTVELDADNDGTPDVFSAALTTNAFVPPTPLNYGNWRWRVNQNNGLGTGTWRPLTITPVMPVVTQKTPLPGALTNDNTRTLEWNPVSLPPASPGATLTQYVVQISQNALFTPGGTTQELTVAYPTTTLDTPALADGLWYWRVFVQNNLGVRSPATGPWSFVVDTTPPATAPTLLQPLNNAITSAARPVLVWSIPLTAVKYNIEVSTDNTFSASTGLNSPVVSINNHPANSIVLTTSLPQGVYYWTVQPVDAAGNAGAFSAPFSFTVDIKVAPAVNTVTTLRQPTFVWALVPVNTGNPPNTYTVELDADNDGTPDVFSAALTTSAFVPPTPLNYGNWRWRVNQNNGLGAGTWRPLTITPVMPAVVQNTPANGALTNDNTVTLSWIAPVVPAGATFTQYAVQISQNPSFTPGGTTQELTVPYPTTTLDTPALADGLWYWRVFVQNSLGVRGPATAARVFTVDTVAPAAPGLSSPLNSAVVTAARPTFIWGIPLTAVKYNIEISTSSTFDPVTGLNTPIFSQNNILMNSLLLPTSLPQGVYYWTVQACDAAANCGQFAAPRAFTIDIKVSPLPNTVTNLRQPTFVWALVPLNTGNPANTYTVELDENNDGTPEVSSAALTTSVFVPATPLNYGNWRWRVNVNNGLGTGDWRNLTITPVMPSVTQKLPAPAALTADNTPTFEWNPASLPPGSTGATLTQYVVQISQNPAFTAGGTTQELTIAYPATTLTAPTLADGIWYWRVFVENNFGARGPATVAWTFTVDTAPPAAPTPISPANNVANFTTVQPVFTWNIPTGAVKYDLQLSTAALTDGTPFVTVLTNSYMPPSPLLFTTYNWRLRSIDAAGNVSGWGTTFTLNILSPAGAAPVLNRFTDSTPVLTWGFVTWAASYEVQVSSSPAFPVGALTRTLTVTQPAVGTIPSVEVTPALTNGTYYWRVRALPAVGTPGAYSTTGTFTVES